MTKTQLDPEMSRSERERLFHNQWASEVRVDELLVRPSFESPTALENRYILRQMGDLKGKRLLDLGCGAGESSVYFAMMGAEVHACDISEDQLKLAQELAKKNNVTIRTYNSPAEKLPFPSGSFDLVYGNGVLHHVDLEPAMAEVARIMVPGARGYFIEPLPYNPLINIYRWIARDVRTPDEKPLHFSQIRGLKKFFSELNHSEFWLFSLYLFIHFFLIRRWHPSKVRYWKKIIEVGNEYKGMIDRLSQLDEKMIRLCPFLGALCWNTVVQVRK